MNEQPMTSVLMSVYKPDLKYFRQQLKSLEEQSYTNMEILIWDDCPEEHLEDEIAQVLKKKKFIYLTCDRNLGYVKAFETLVKRAEGKYIAFCDQDDLWEADKVLRSVEELERQDAILVTSDRMIIDKDNRIVSESVRHSSKNPAETWHTGDDISGKAVFSCYGLGMTIVMRTDAAKKMLPFTRNTGHDKWVVMCAAVMGKVCYIDEVLQKYRRHGNNLSGAFNRLSGRQEYYDWRVRTSYLMVQELLKRFPDHPHRKEIEGFSKARKKRKVSGILRYAYLAPKVAVFECILKFTPDRVFDTALKIMRQKRKI